MDKNPPDMHSGTARISNITESRLTENIKSNGNDDTDDAADTYTGEHAWTDTAIRTAFAGETGLVLSTLIAACTGTKERGDVACLAIRTLFDWG